MIDTEVPVKLLGISYHWALIGALAAGTLLMTFEMITYWSLREGLLESKIFDNIPGMNFVRQFQGINALRRLKNARRKITEE